MFCEHHNITKYARYRYLLEAKLFLHPLNRGEGDIAELGDIPQALALPEQLDDLRVLLFLLLPGLRAACLPSHLHAFRFRQLSSLRQTEVDVLALLFRAEPEATDVDSHYAIHLVITEQGQSLLLEVEVDAVVRAKLDCLQDFPDGTTATG